MRRNFLLSFLVISFGVLLFANLARAEAPSDEGKRALVQNLVNEAIKLIDTRGEAALKTIDDKNGKFNTKDTYVFVTSETGADLINPAFREIEGMPLETYSDQSSKDAQMAIVNAVKDKDSAWVEYLWPQPGETKPSKKVSYLKKIIINGKVRIVGAGFYPNN